ncbi:hypothetical protein TPA0907_15170 [Micromonospora humidisoli]|nr:hypothetical protein TPA0907_15170 [Micromonospora sp. AKA109]
MSFDLREQAGAGDAGAHPGDRREPPGEHGGGLLFSEPQLGVLVKLPTQPYQIVNVLVRLHHAVHSSPTSDNPDLIETRT